MIKLDTNYYKQHWLFCTNVRTNGKACCGLRNGEKFAEYAKDSLKKHNLHGKGKIRVSRTACLGRCSDGPILVIYPEATWYQIEDFADIDDLVAKALQK